MTTPHSSQMMDGSDVEILVSTLPLPTRVTAVRNVTTGILTYTNEPALYTGTGSTAGKLIQVVGSMDLNTTFGKNAKEFRLFNDDGWTQDKILGRNWQATMQGMYVRNTSTTSPDLEDSFKIFFENALSKEEEVYVKFRKKLGIIPAVTGPPAVAAKVRYLIEAGNIKVTSFSDQGQADSMLQVNATLKGQGPFIYGFEEVSLP
jgi:hypothetical protein